MQRFSKFMRTEYDVEVMKYFHSAGLFSEECSTKFIFYLQGESCKNWLKSKALTVSRGERTGRPR